MVMAILLYEQFIHHAKIISCPNTQCLNTQQCAYQSFKLPPGLINDTYQAKFDLFREFTYYPDTLNKVSFPLKASI